MEGEKITLLLVPNDDDPVFQGLGGGMGNFFFFLILFSPDLEHQIQCAFIVLYYFI